jgi:hypothetical protein
MGTMLDRFLIDLNVPTTSFACDLDRCKGACCTMPGQRGAPLLDEEVEEIEKAYPIVQKYLSFRHRDTIEERGLVQGRARDHTTQVVDRKACVFAYFESDIAKCAFEKAFLSGEISWRKPISCHLFPIRVAPGYPTRLRFEELAECQPAMERGATQDIPLHEFLRIPLTRAYGEEWYQEFRSYCQHKKVEPPQEQLRQRSEE